MIILVLHRGKPFLETESYRACLYGARLGHHHPFQSGLDHSPPTQILDAHKFIQHWLLSPDASVSRTFLAVAGGRPTGCPESSEGDLTLPKMVSARSYCSGLNAFAFGMTTAEKRESVLGQGGRVRFGAKCSIRVVVFDLDGRARILFGGSNTLDLVHRCKFVKADPVRSNPVEGLTMTLKALTCERTSFGLNFFSCRSGGVRMPRPWIRLRSPGGGLGRSTQPSISHLNQEIELMYLLRAARAGQSTHFWHDGRFLQRHVMPSLLVALAKDAPCSNQAFEFPTGQDPVLPLGFLSTIFNAPLHPPKCAPLRTCAGIHILPCPPNHHLFTGLEPTPPQCTVPVPRAVPPPCTHAGTTQPSTR